MSDAPTATPASAQSVAAAQAAPVSDCESQHVIAAMRRRSPEADPVARLPDVHPGRIPRHIAIIMDGNGRWAEQRGFPRVFGHRNGAGVVRDVVEECGRLGVECLTLYSFSLENWKRPSAEVQALMDLYTTYLDGEADEIRRKNIRFVQIGRREGLPPQVLEAVDRITSLTAANTGPTLCLAVNYGARAEITDAVRAIAERARRGEIAPDAIDESTIASHLYTAGLPDPDLLIRTAGERRVSNYLLWQISYAEIHVTETLWPDFAVADLHAAIRDFAGRTRRFGGLSDPRPAPPA